MDKEKFTEKLKEGISVQELETFARRHTTEVFSAIGIVIAAISSAFDFFTGSGWSVIFAALGAVVAIFFPAHVEKGLKQLYGFTYKQEKTTQIILGGVKIVIAIFIPFVTFAIVGLLSGTSYHYYTRHAQIVGENQSQKGRKETSGEEHD